MVRVIPKFTVTSVLVLLLLIIVDRIGFVVSIRELTDQIEFVTDLDVEETWDEWLDVNEFYTMVTPDGEIITETGRRIYTGDQYLTASNLLYEVINVDDQNIAHTRFVEEVKLPTMRMSIQQIRQELGLAVAWAQEENSTGRIAIYHTHNAESYIPTDGTHSINGVGGIHAVGEAFSSSLKRLGIDTDYAEDLHLPHDRGAYRRSRNTVLSLLAQEPDAIFDVHRDAAPKHAYATQIENEAVTQVQFVVGRQNQNLGVNRQYAQSLKEIADQVYPGLVKGIFFGRGNYNQDLTPLNLLLEVGAHTNSAEAAARGISLFAEVVDFYFYGPRDQRETADGMGSPPGGGRAASTTLIWLFAFLIAGGGVFYVINAGGWAQALNRLRRK